MAAQENVQAPQMINPIYTQIAEALKKIIDTTYPHHNLSGVELYSLLGEAPNLKMGHVAFGCFPLAKVCRTAPPKIATELAEKMVPHLQQWDCIQEAQAVGPYLNFFLSPQGIGKHIIEPINNGTFLTQTILESHERWMVEYSQPNTHKVLHVGHMRNLCLGNALVRMAQYAGQEVLAVTYPGDVGTHVAKCLWYLEYHQKEQPPETHKGAWLGEMYTKANKMLEEQRETEHEESNRSALTEILKQLHDQKGPFFEKWKETRDWSIQLMQDVYDWADVKFDRWFWESEMDAPSLQLAQQLHIQNLLIKDQGAIGMDLSEDNLGFCLMVKSDGTGLYATKDVQLAKIKFEEFSVDKNIYIVDDRQAHHFKQVFKVLEKIGFKKAKNCFHLQYNVVELPDGAMSSRKGNIIPLMDLIQMMENKIKEKYLQKYLNDPNSGWTQEDVVSTARMIANGAIKYGMIRVDNNRKIVFDMDEWLKLDGETGPYLQYVHARILSLCNKLNYNPQAPLNWSGLQKDSEMALLIKIIKFKDVIASGVQNLQTMHLCGYLYDLGKLFNSFYSECPIGKAETKELKNTRMALAHAAGSIMYKGLEILGIPAPSRM